MLARHLQPGVPGYALPHLASEAFYVLGNSSGKAMGNYMQKAAHEEQLLLPGNPFDLQGEELVARHHIKLYGTPGESASLVMQAVCAPCISQARIYIGLWQFQLRMRCQTLCAPTSHAVRHFRPRHCT